MLGKQCFDRGAHRPEVYGHVRGIGYQAAAGIEDRTGKIEAFLDVDRLCGATQHLAHLRSDVHEQAVEDLDLRRVIDGAAMSIARSVAAAGEQRATWHRGDFPTGLEHEGRVRLDEQQRSLHAVLK